jgi:hypothetical protein
MTVNSLVINTISVGIAYILLRLIFSYTTSPLRSIPGPFLAKFTDLWRLRDYWLCTQIQSHQELHKKLGPAVRIGPNMVSLSEPDLLKTVYSTRADYMKVSVMTIYPTT